MKGGGVLLAILLGVFLAVGQCGGSSSGSSSDSSSSGSSSSDGGGSGDQAAALKKRLEKAGLHVEKMETDTSDNCAAHAYGQVRTHLADTSCDRVERAWYLVCNSEDDTAVLSVAWVRMPDDDSARELQALVDEPGTGNITELSRENGPYQQVRYTGAHYASGRDADTFLTAQAEPLEDSSGAREVATQAAQLGGTT